MTACVLCASPENCTECLFKDNWGAWENNAHRERIRERAVKSLEEALRKLQGGLG